MSLMKQWNLLIKRIWSWVSISLQVSLHEALLHAEVWVTGKHVLVWLFELSAELASSCGMSFSLETVIL